MRLRFKVTLGLLLGAILLILGIGFITAGPTGKSWFMESTITILSLGVVVGLLGLHLLSFCRDWAGLYSNFFQQVLPRSGFLKGWLGIHMSYRFQLLLAILSGIFLILLGIVFLLKGMTR
jgi:hypothetical protein